MANFLLIHGASHGAWCWDRVIPALAEHGHDATAIDLPGHGQDQTPRRSVRMADYVSAVRKHMTAETVLVGHSFGGFPITLAAAEADEKPCALVYLCALIPRPGLAFTAFRADAISTELSAAQTVDRDAGVTRADPEKARDVFYSDCARSDQDWALAHITPQPIAVMTEALEFEPPNVPRHYIRCTEDRVIFPEFQRRISEGWSSTFEMRTGHSPFLSDPQGLAAILDRIAAA